MWRSTGGLQKKKKNFDAEMRTASATALLRQRILLLLVVLVHPPILRAARSCEYWCAEGAPFTCNQDQCRLCDKREGAEEKKGRGRDGRKKGRTGGAGR